MNENTAMSLDDCKDYVKTNMSKYSKEIEPNWSYEDMFHYIVGYSEGILLGIENHFDSDINKKYHRKSKREVEIDSKYVKSLVGIFHKNTKNILNEFAEIKKLNTKGSEMEITADLSEDINLLLRTTPEQINELKENEIFVFGSNLAGRHGAGAAKTALMWGATYGQGAGRQGQTYAIPTKDMLVKTLSLDEIMYYVDQFIAYAQKQKDKTFLVTQIGCGLAGYTPQDIAPLFKEAMNVENIWLPECFWEVLEK